MNKINQYLLDGKKLELESFTKLVTYIMLYEYEINDESLVISHSLLISHSRNDSKRFLNVSVFGVSILDTYCTL